jgi:alpha-beta hydrolase superfamily lysophospholipase
VKPRAMVMALALVAAGCGGGSHAPAPQRPAATATRPAATLPAPATRCGPPRAPARTLWFTARDGVRLDGAIVGSGRVGAVLIHEYPGPMCGWWPYAHYLGRHGVRALLFDLRCFGLSGCPAHRRGDVVADVAAAMRALRRDGARRVALVGASMGGSIAVVAAARLRPAALVDLSGELDTSGLTPGISAKAGAAAPSVRVPALFAVARGDRYVPVADMRTVYRRTASRAKRLVVLPAVAGHGWGMLLGTRTTWSALARQAAAFIRTAAHQ